MVEAGQARSFLELHLGQKSMASKYSQPLDINVNVEIRHPHHAICTLSLWEQIEFTIWCIIDPTGRYSFGCHSLVVMLGVDADICFPLANSSVKYFSESSTYAPSEQST